MKTDLIPSLDRVVSATRSICSPPLIYNRLNETINHPRASIQDIARIISEDQGLTARLLRMANSPLYGFTRIDSISRAVTLIGTREIRDLVLALTITKSFQKIPENLLKLEEHWQHSVACAIISKNIAFYLREPNVERFFVAGILHDIGRLALCLVHPEAVRSIHERALHANQSLYVLEQKSLKFDHAKLGGALLKAWNIPDNISQPVAFHHQPSLSRSYKRDATIIHAADLICHSLAYGTNPRIPISRLDEKAWSELEFPLSGLETVVKQSDLQLEEILVAIRGDL